MPASAMAFAKVDLDPSASQKVDCFRFARQFPGARDPLSGMDANYDLREVTFHSTQKEGGLDGVAYEQDIEPWLGQRVGIAVLPVEGSNEPGVVIALASTDEGVARAGLDKATRDRGHCSGQADFAICGEKQAVVDQAVNDAATESLAETDTFARDMDDLGEEGRYAVVLCLEGPTLELAGRVNGLPADTLAAFAITGLDESLTKAWPTIDSNLGDAIGSDGQQGLDGFTAETGVVVPDDIIKAVGSDTVVATDTGPVDQIASVSGLADSRDFTDAVPDVDMTGTVAHVDLSRSVELFADGMSQEERDDVEPFSALGLAMWGPDDHADFRLRLTTK